MSTTNALKHKYKLRTNTLLTKMCVHPSMSGFFGVTCLGLPAVAFNTAQNI